AEKTAALTEGAEISAAELCPRHPEVAVGALAVLTAAGWLTAASTRTSHVTTTGARGFAKGPGPFGIIETYHPYMAQGRDILVHGPQKVWVARGENVGASQDANR